MSGGSRRKCREVIEGCSLTISAIIYASMHIHTYIYISQAHIAAAAKPPLWIGSGYRSARHVSIYCKNIVINKEATTITTIYMQTYIRTQQNFECGIQANE